MCIIAASHSGDNEPWRSSSPQFELLIILITVFLSCPCVGGEDLEGIVTLPLSKGNVRVMKTEAWVRVSEHVCHEFVCALFVFFFLELNQAATTV